MKEGNKKLFGILLTVWRKGGEWIIIFIVILGCLLRIIAPEQPHDVTGEFSHVSTTFKLDNSQRNLVVFAQISDTHLNPDHKYKETQLREFISSELQRVNPAFTLVTGDLTDNKNWESPEEEWKIYKQVLVDSNIWGRNDTWIDIPGNHDVGNVINKGDSNDYHQKYCSWPKARTHDPVLSFDYSLDETKIRFLMLNVPSYPGFFLNFDGDFSSQAAKELKTSLELSENYTHTFIASHFCGGYLASPNLLPFEKQIQNKGIPEGSSFTALLCGHRHSHKMYSRSGKGHLEIEVVDFAYHLGTRIAAIDNGIFSFTDRSLGSWPIILITNPKNAQFLTENDPLSLIQTSTHIRALIWHNIEIDLVSAYIDDVTVCNSMARSSLNSSLFTCIWNPNLYSDGFHTIKVVVTDSNGTISSSETQTFSLNGKPLKFKGLFFIELEMPMIQFLTVWLIVSVLISLGYMLILPNLIDFLKSFVLSLEEMSQIGEILDGKNYESLFSNEFPLKKKVLFIVFLPLLGTMKMMTSLPIWYSIVSTIFGILPLIIPLAYGKFMTEGTCKVFSWGWAYCANDSSTMEMFSLIEGSMYYSLVFPTCLLAGARLFERIRLAESKRVVHFSAEILPFIPTVAGIIGIWFLLFYSLGALSSFMSPVVWCGILFLAITIFVFIKEIKRSKNKQKTPTELDPIKIKH